VQSFKYLGDVALKNKNVEKAMSYYSYASPIGDGGYALASNPNVDVEVAMYFDEQVQHKKAERLYRRVDRRVGGDEESTTLLGRNLQLHEQFEAIDGLYLSRLTDHPNWEFVWEEYVGWLKRDGMYDRAIVMSTKAVEENQDSKRLRIQLALLESEFGNPEHAVRHAQVLTEAHPNDPSMWMLLARSYDSNNQREEAQEAVSTATQLFELRRQQQQLDR